MALNIKNVEVETLATEIASLTRVSKTEAIRTALLERRERLKAQRDDRIEGVLKWLRSDVWPRVPADVRRPMSRDEEDAILGLSSDGV